MSDLGTGLPVDASAGVIGGGTVPIVLPQAPAERPPWRTRSVEELLFEEGPSFDFFQAVRLLERLAPSRRPVGRQGTSGGEVVRFRAHPSLGFPASSIHEITPPTAIAPVPVMTVTFIGLTGPSGVLPRDYTELLIRRHLDFKGAERYVLRDWLDLFNHRLTSLFHRAWEKYRFWIAYERSHRKHPAPDTFTACLLSLIGQGMPTMRNRLQVSLREEISGRSREQVLARVEDLSLLRYVGILSQRRRSAMNLEALLADYFRVPVHVEQFQGQWLQLVRDNQSRLDANEQAARLGVNVVVGQRVWDVQGKIRIRLGPLHYQQFCTFFPDFRPVTQHKALFLLAHLVRLFVGPELDFDVQLVLRDEDVPPTQLCDDAEIGPRLGWNTWIRTAPFEHDAEDAIIAAADVRWIEQTSTEVN